MFVCEETSQFWLTCATDECPPQPTDARLCRGLIHRTEAGWKHCVERLRGSKRVSTEEPTHTIQDPGGTRDGGSLRDDEYDHFYYLDGVLKREKSHFYPDSKRQGSQADTRDGVPAARTKGGTRERLFSYIYSLAMRYKDKK